MAVSEQNRRAIRASMKIGWAIESNWTKPPLYLLYVALRPLAMCVLLYYLFKVISPAPAGDARFVSIYLGNAFFSVFGVMASSLSWAVISDREHYQIIRYVYISPAPFVWTIIGRAATFVLTALSSVVIILAVGGFLLRLPLHPWRVDWPLLLASTALGLAATLALGLFFAGLLLVTARHSLLLAEGVGGVFLLVCGVLYPTTYLPTWAQPVALAIPVTYWLEAVRRAFGVTNFDPNLAALPSGLLLLILLALTAAIGVLGVKAFGWFEHYAKRHGKLDQVTNY
jgi:ABC-2 type transport system permease protein